MSFPLGTSSCGSDYFGLSDLTGQWVFCLAGWRPAPFFFFFRMAYATVGQRETVVKHPLQSNGPAWVERETAKGH